MKYAPASCCGRKVYEEWATRSGEQYLNLFHRENRDDYGRIVPSDWGFRLRARGVLAKRRSFPNTNAGSGFELSLSSVWELGRDPSWSVDRIAHARWFGTDHRVLLIQTPRPECRKCQRVLNGSLPGIEPCCNYTKSFAGIGSEDQSFLPRAWRVPTTKQ
jgi:hypothetical protein